MSNFQDQGGFGYGGSGVAGYTSYVAEAQGAGAGAGAFGTTYSEEQVVTEGGGFFGEPGSDIFATAQPMSKTIVEKTVSSAPRPPPQVVTKTEVVETVVSAPPYVPPESNALYNQADFQTYEETVIEDKGFLSRFNWKMWGLICLGLLLLGGLLTGLIFLIRRLLRKKKIKPIVSPVKTIVRAKKAAVRTTPLAFNQTKSIFEVEKKTSVVPMPIPISVIPPEKKIEEKIVKEAIIAPAVTKTLSEEIDVKRIEGIPNKKIEIERDRIVESTPLGLVADTKIFAKEEITNKNYIYGRKSLMFGLATPKFYNNKKVPAFTVVGGGTPSGAIEKTYQTTKAEILPEKSYLFAASEKKELLAPPSDRIESMEYKAKEVIDSGLNSSERVIREAGSTVKESIQAGGDRIYELGKEKMESEKIVGGGGAWEAIKNTYKSAGEKISNAGSSIASTFRSSVKEEAIRALNDESIF